MNLNYYIITMQKLIRSLNADMLNERGEDIRCVNDALHHLQHAVIALDKYGQKGGYQPVVDPNDKRQSKPPEHE